MIVRCVIIFYSTLKQTIYSKRKHWVKFGSSLGQCRNSIFTNTHSLILVTYVALPLVGGSGQKNYILESTVYNLLF